MRASRALDSVTGRQIERPVGQTRQSEQKRLDVYDTKCRVASKAVVGERHVSLYQFCTNDDFAWSASSEATRNTTQTTLRLRKGFLLSGQPLWRYSTVTVNPVHKRANTLTDNRWAMQSDRETSRQRATQTQTQEGGQMGTQYHKQI